MESAGLGRSRCIRYDGGWETVYWLDGEGALVLPQQVLASYRLPAGGTAMQPGRSWLGLLPFRQTLFLVDRGLL